MVLLQLIELVASVPGKEPQLLAVARSERIDLLRALYQAESVAPYPDELPDGSTVMKLFRKDGPLEMYVPPSEESQMFVDLGNREERLRSMIQELTEKVNTEWDAIVQNTLSCDDGLELLKLIQPNNQVGEVNVGN